MPVEAQETPQEFFSSQERSLILLVLDHVLHDHVFLNRGLQHGSALGLQHLTLAIIIAHIDFRGLLFIDVLQVQRDLEVVKLIEGVA